MANPIKSIKIGNTTYDIDFSDYLSISGGTMKNGAIIAFANSGNWSTESTSNSGVTFPYSCGGLSWSDQSDGISLYAEATGNDNLDLVIKFTDDNSNKLSIRNASGTQTAYITANGTAYFTGGVNSATKATQDGNGNVITSTYVNLSGTQTISGIKTFSKSSGFNYSGIETATSDSFRNVWFSHNSNIGTPVKSDNFKYNPSTNTLQVGKLYGKETMLKESDSSYTATVGGYDMYTWNDDFCVSLRNTDETHNFYILQYDYSASKLITSNNLTAKTLTTSQNSNYIDFVTYSGTNFGLQGNSGTVYNLASFAKSADLKKVATSGSYSDLSDKPNILLLNNATSWTWGTLTTANGYTLRGSYDEPDGGSVAFAAKSGQTSVQIDGRFYDREGLYRLVDTDDLSTTLSSYAKTSSIGNGTLTIQAEGTTKGTFTANQSSASTINLKASDFGLSSALKFLGTSSTEITEGSTTSKITLTDGTTVTATTGNVVLYGHKEFIWNAAWEELGDESSHALKSVTITGTGALSGGGSLEANRTITHNTTTRTNNTSSASPAVGATFTAIDSVTSDTYGHITAVNTKTVTMPYDTSKLPLTGGTMTGKLTVPSVLVSGGRVYGSGDDEGIVINYASSNYAGVCLGTYNGERSVFYMTKGKIPFWRYNDGSNSYDLKHPSKNGTIATTDDIPSSLKNPNAISFKNTSGSTVLYDGSSILDLTDGIYYATKATQDGSGNTITSTYVKKISASDTKVYANSGGTDTSYTITSVNTTPNTIVFRNGSTGYSVINTPADTSTTSTYIANTGWVNGKLASKSDTSHTHTLTLTSGGTSAITLSASTVYTLTAGGKSIAFTTPPNTNTWRGIQNNLTSTSTTDSLSAAQGKVLNEAKVAKSGDTMTGTLAVPQLSYTSSNTVKVYTKYNATTESLDTVFE